MEGSLGIFSPQTDRASAVEEECAELRVTVPARKQRGDGNRGIGYVRHRSTHLQPLRVRFHGLPEAQSGRLKALKLEPIGKARGSSPGGGRCAVMSAGRYKREKTKEVVRSHTPSFSPLLNVRNGWKADVAAGRLMG